MLGDIPSLRENWSDAALFVDPRDRQALASAIQGVVDDPIGRRRLGLRAMARARYYTVTRMAYGYADAYQHVLSDAAVA